MRGLAGWQAGRLERGWQVLQDAGRSNAQPAVLHQAPLCSAPVCSAAGMARSLRAMGCGQCGAHQGKEGGRLHFCPCGWAVYCRRAGGWQLVGHGGQGVSSGEADC